MIRVYRQRLTPWLQKLLHCGFGLLLVSCAPIPLDYREADAPEFSSFDSEAARPPRLALVLGSGGPRGFAHIGVIKVLEAHGIAPDLVVGSSSGAFVGVLYAAGYGAAELERRAMALRRADVLDISLVGGGKVIGQALQDYVNEALGGRRLEQLASPLAVVATRNGGGERTVFNRGNAGVAVRASSAVPDTFLPVRINGVEFVDGDVASPLPVRLARELGAARVIAVDVAQNVERAPAPLWAPDWWTEQAVARRRLIEAEAPLADVVIEPPLPYLTAFGTDYRAMAIATGERAALARLERLKRIAAP